MWFGNAHEGYERAGLGGNPAGARYWIDSFELVSEGPSPEYRVARVRPVPGSRWCGGPIRISLARGRLASLCLAQVVLAVNGRRVELDDTCVQYDFDRPAIVLDLRSRGIELDDKKRARFSIRLTSPGKGKAASYDWQYVIDHRLDRDPPRVVAIPQERGRLRVINRVTGGPMTAILHERTLSVGKNPILTFDYRLSPGAHVDLIFRTVAGSRHVRLSDTDDDDALLGSIASVGADGRWHRARIDLKKLLDRAVPVFTPSQYEVRNLRFGDWGYRASLPGTAAHFDNVLLAPAASTAHPFELEWGASDISGISGFSHRWSDRERDEAPKVVMTQARRARFSRLPEGLRYFHIKTRDRAGNWGATRHYPFLIDNTPPAFAGQSPKNDEASAADRIEVTIAERGSGVDPSSFSVSLDGEARDLEPETTTFDPARNVFRWNWVRARPPMHAPIRDGQKMDFAMAPIADFAGNRSRSIQWSWRISHAADRKGPIAPLVSCETHPLLAYDSFSDSLGEWQPHGPAGATVERTHDAERCDMCLRLTRKTNARVGALAVVRSFDAAKYPIVAYDHKIPAGVGLNWLARIDDAWYPIGQSADARADGQWHSAWFDLRECLTGSAGSVVHSLAVEITGNRDVSLLIDNFSVSGPGGSKPVFRWAARDATGIASCRFRMTTPARATPNRETKPGNGTITPGVLDRPGLWHFEIAARDGAGNWGAVGRYPYFMALAERTR